MKRILFLVLLISALFITACANNQVSNNSDDDSKGKIKVYTSFYTLYDFASKIGGDHAQVVNMIPSGGDPHHWEPTASDIANLEKAHIFIYNGLELEHWVDSILNTINNEDLIITKASQHIDAIESHHEHEHEHDHSHGDLDPHIWLDPANAKAMFDNIKEAFIEADPDNEAYYEDRYKEYIGEFDSLDREFEEGLYELTNRDMVVSHQAFTYLSQAYNLNQVGIQGLIPDSEPSPSRMAEIIDFINENHIETIFFEDINDTSIVDTISRETGVNIKALYTLEYLTDEQMNNNDDYFSIMRENLNSLVNGLK